MQAVLVNGVLHTAIEIQKSHANSAKKLSAFEKHGIVSVQIDATELNNRCYKRDWESKTTVVVENHPVTKLVLSRCAVCETLYQEEQARIEAIEAATQIEKQKREEYEKLLVTDFDQLEDNKYLKCFIGIPIPKGCEPKKKKSEWLLVYLNHTQWDANLNPHPRNLKFLTKKGNLYDSLKANNGAPMCVKLVNVKSDNWNPKEKVLFWYKHIHFHPGLDLPKYNP